MNRGRALAGLLCGLLAVISSAGADFAPPQATRAVRVDARLGAQVPRSLVFVTPEGLPVRLDQYVRGDLPVLLVFAYARCKSLCSVVLQSATELIRGMQNMQPGRDYRPLVVGLDPNQTLEEARRHQARLLDKIGRPGQRERFPYLLGKQAQVEALADRVGFRYAWDPRSEQYAHPAVMMVLDRDGRVARYLHALGTTPDELASALRTADGTATSSDEHAQSSLAGDLLRCFRFDPALRRHQDAIALYFRIGGVVIFALLASLVIGLFVWERRRNLS